MFLLRLAVEQPPSGLANGSPPCTLVTMDLPVILYVDRCTDKVGKGQIGWQVIILLLGTAGSQCPRGTYSSQAYRGLCGGGGV